jgi:hypothetical protein
MHSGAASQEHPERAVTGMTAADEAGNLQNSVAMPPVTPNPEQNGCASRRFRYSAG